MDLCWEILFTRMLDSYLVLCYLEMSRLNSLNVKNKNSYKDMIYWTKIILNMFTLSRVVL